jgi:hypothetical protein
MRFIIIIIIIIIIIVWDHEFLVLCENGRRRAGTTNCLDKHTVSYINTPFMCHKKKRTRGWRVAGIDKVGPEQRINNQVEAVSRKWNKRTNKWQLTACQICSGRTVTNLTTTDLKNCTTRALFPFCLYAGGSDHIPLCRMTHHWPKKPIVYCLAH